ncbi:MAG: hypothetical protein AAB973_03510 [Patescibacteria group bacterium]
MAYDPDRLKELTADIVGGIKKRRSDSRAEMEASRVVPEKLPVAPEDEGPAGSLDGMGQVAGNLRGERPESPEKAAEKWEKVGGRWVKRV